MKTKRIWELDFLRGFAIIMMVFDHLMYDFSQMDGFFRNFYTVDIPVFNWLEEIAEKYWMAEIRTVGHFLFIAVFLIVSGISFTFSTSNLKRSVKLFIVASLITVVTLVINEISSFDVVIIFGIIHMFALATFLTYLFRKIWDNDIFILALGTAIIIYGFTFNFWDFHYVADLSFKNIIGIIIGTRAYGADSFGIVPYTGIIMIGTVIGNVFYKNKVSLLPQVKISQHNLIMVAGKNSLIVFVTHQFVLFGMIYLIGLIFGYSV